MKISSLLMLSVAFSLGFSFMPAHAATVKYAGNGEIDWHASVDDLTALDKSVARQYEDTTLDFSGTVVNENTENHADVIIKQVDKIAKAATKLQKAITAANAAKAKIDALDEKMAALEKEMEDINAGNLFGENAAAAGLMDPLTMAKKVENELKYNDLEKEKAALENQRETALANYHNFADQVNADDQNLQAIQNSLDRGTANSLYSEALAGTGLSDSASIRTAMKTEEGRATLQKNLDSMYDKYLSATPKLDLSKKEDQAYAEKFLKALSGQSLSQGQVNHTIPTYLTRDGSGRGFDPYTK